jgi:3-methylcrotonyl-CoA carboxylase alpha subunit
MKIQLFRRGEPIEIEVDGTGEERELRFGETRSEVSAIAIGPTGGTLRLNGRPARFLYERSGGRVRISVGGECHEFELTGQPKSKRSAAHGNPETRSPMPGKVLEVTATPGMEVKPGDPLIILEAMKMENVLCAEVAGAVTEVHAKPGDMVEPGKLLVLVEPAK